MIPEKYLPLGSVVLLQGGERRVMIIGYAVTPQDEPNKTYDYLACLYPEGVISTDQNLVFDHSQIAEISALGFHDEESAGFHAKLKEVLQGGGVPTDNGNVNPTTPTDNLF